MEDLGHVCRPSRPSCRHCTLLITLLGASACKEQGSVKVTSMAFNGLKAVKASQLEVCSGTGASSKLPWARSAISRASSSRRILKRIAAFYHDRKYPEARVSSFDVKLSADQSRSRSR